MLVVLLVLLVVLLLLLTAPRVMWFQQQVLSVSGRR